MTEHNHEHDHDKEFITIIDENGNETLHEILLTFESDEFKKSYVVVYPAGSMEDDDVELQAFSFTEDEEGESGNLQPIESDEEWDMVEEVLNTFLDDEEIDDEVEGDIEE